MYRRYNENNMRSGGDGSSPPNRRGRQQQTQAQGLEKKQRRAQVFLKQTRQAMNTIDHYVRAVASGDRDEAEACNLLATSALNLMQDSAKRLRKEQNYDIVQMALVDVRANIAKMRSEHRGWIESSEEVGAAFEHCFGYLEASLSGDDVPILPAGASVPDSPMAWNAVFGRMMLAQHEQDRFERRLDSAPEEFQREQERLLAAAGELPRQTSGFDVSILTRHYEPALPSNTREPGSEEKMEPLCGGRGREGDVQMEDAGDGFDWIRQLNVGAPLQVRDNRGQVFDCQLTGVSANGVRVYVLALQKEVEVSFVQVVEPFAAPCLS